MELFLRNAGSTIRIILLKHCHGSKLSLCEKSETKKAKEKLIKELVAANFISPDFLPNEMNYNSHDDQIKNKETCAIFLKWPILIYFPRLKSFRFII